MSFRWYVILMGVGTGLAWISWLFVIQTMNPEEAGLTAFMFFYITLFLSLVGTLSLVGLLFRIGLRREPDMLTRVVRISFRHALLLSLGAVTALWLSAHRQLAWYWIVVLIALIAGVEYLFLMIQSARRQ